MAETLNCTALHGMLTPPANPRARQRFRRAVALNRAQQPVRKIWDCILFGFEMPLLLLHMQTLEAVVDGFLVTESTTCFQTSKAKPAVLSNALAAGSLPVALAKMTTVRVITLEEGKDAGCRDMALPSRSSGGSADGGSQSRSYSGRCFQSVQRLALLTLLAQKAAPDDLAFVADVDEIVAPRLVSLLRTCAPFPPFEDWHRHGMGAGHAQGSDDFSAYPGYIHIAARQLMYGAHCDFGETWKDGPRLYHAGWVLHEFRVDVSPPSKEAEAAWARGKARGGLNHARWPRALVARRFDALRPMGHGKDGALVASGGGWHLTSWGSADDVHRKLTTFGAAARFGGGGGALDRVRLEACRRNCVELLFYRNASSPQPEPTPCHLQTMAAMRLKRKAMPRNARRYSIRSVLADGRPLTAAVLRHVFRRGELPPYLIAHPEAFPTEWFSSLRSEVPGWAVGPEPITGVPVMLWCCPALNTAHSHSTLPALLLYRLGEMGPTMAKHQFEFVAHDEDVGDVYVVADATSYPPALSGPLAARSCAVAKELDWADIGPAGVAGPAGNHYSGRWCMQKLELLRHLPDSVETAVLLDADGFLLPRGMRVLKAQLAQLGSQQFVAAPRTDARVERRSSDGTRSLSVPKRSEGINSGLLAIHIPRMRAFEAQFCPGQPWWRCILRDQPKGYNHVGGDQAVWNALLVDRPQVWRPLPCGTHLSIDALRAAAARFSSDAAVALCVPLPLGAASPEASVFRGAHRSFETCGEEQVVHADDTRFGPVPRANASLPWPLGAAVTHGAARLQPLARLVAALIAAPTVQRRREIFRAFPCWCYHYIRSDGVATFGAPRGTPKGDTGCHSLSYARPPSEADPHLAGEAMTTVLPPTLQTQKPTASPTSAAAEPSFSAARNTPCNTSGAGGSVRGPPTAAFCLTGHPRTFIHPEAQQSIVRALKSFGAHAYTFFVMTDDDGGSSWAHPPIRSSASDVHAAMAVLRPKVVDYGTLNVSLASYAAERRKACGMPPEGLTRAIGSRPFMQTFFESHHKLRACHEHVMRYEAQHRMRFDWIVRMRPDAWFFGSLPAHCELAQGRISFPAGVVGCGYAPCINDHLSFMPRALSPYYFRIADDMRSCVGLRNLSKHWKDYNVWRLMTQGVPLAEPSPVVPYTLLRPCGNASLASFYPECHRWAAKAGLEKNAGLAHYSNGSALPNLADYRLRRSQTYIQCVEAAERSFPAFASTGQGADGLVNMPKVRACAMASDSRRTAIRRTGKLRGGGGRGG